VQDVCCCGPCGNSAEETDVQKHKDFPPKTVNVCDIITDLKKKEMISTNCEEMLQQASSGVPLKWILR